MLKDYTFSQKMQLLKDWLPVLVDSVKRDLKNDHLKQDVSFAKANFAGKNISKLTTEELVPVYQAALENEEHAEMLGEFIAHRWLIKNTEVFDYFASELSKIEEDFSKLELLDENRSEEIIQGAVSEFGAPRAYLFSVLNSVVFPKQSFEKLDKKAKKELLEKKEEEIRQHEEKSVEDMKRGYEAQIARLTDKYEKKLSGLLKKYDLDVKQLKCQISNLQKKLNPQSASEKQKVSR